MAEGEPFVFYTERRMVALTALKARNLPELLAGLQNVPGSSIFYHTHQQFLTLHFEKPTFRHDFAAWVSQALQEEGLAEKLAAIDLLTFTAIRGLRDTLVATVQKHLKEVGNRRECPPGSEFHFCKSKSFIMRTGMVAGDVPDFFDTLPHITNVSLFFHFIEARLRLGRPTNDFAYWLERQGRPELAKRIDILDPYIRTLDELKAAIIELGQAYVK